MTRQFFGVAMGLTLCLSVSVAFGQARGSRGGAEKAGAGRAGGERAGAPKAPGGNWSAGKPSQGTEARGSGGASDRNDPPAGARGAAAGAAATNRNAPNTGAAAGAAAVNRNNPQGTGAEGAAAGAAAANRNAPKTTGAGGAAAGAAAANRNNPQATGAEGAAAGAAAANRNSPNTGAAGAAASYAAVRNSFDRPDLYGQNWHSAHPGAWTATGWAANAEWTNTAWNVAASHCGYEKITPVSFNYGINVTCINGNVLLDGQSVGTAEEFSQQAADLALAGVNAKTEDADKWLPLGVFAMVRNEQQHPQLMLQMAVNQRGELRGNYTDEATDHTQVIRGKVDPKTQRAAWTVGENTASVMEAGLSNLTQGEAPALIHKNGKTDRWMLVRMPQPK